MCYYNRLAQLQNKNDLLEEELKNARNKIHCLEAEMTYFSKESALLNREVKEMAFKMASCGIRGETSEKGGALVNTSPEAEVFYRNPHQGHFDPSDSKSSAMVDPSCPFNYSHPSNFNANSGNRDPESHNELLLHKRENEMNTLIRDYDTNNHSLHAQFQICELVWFIFSCKVGFYEL